jgi:hypothetical protein
MDLIPQHCISPEDKRQVRTLSNRHCVQKAQRLATPGIAQSSSFAGKDALSRSGYSESLFFPEMIKI